MIFPINSSFESSLNKQKILISGNIKSTVFSGSSSLTTSKFVVIFVSHLLYFDLAEKQYFLVKICFLDALYQSALTIYSLYRISHPRHVYAIILTHH